MNVIAFIEMQGILLFNGVQKETRTNVGVMDVIQQIMRVNRHALGRQTSQFVNIPKSETNVNCIN